MGKSVQRDKEWEWMQSTGTTGSQLQRIKVPKKAFQKKKFIWLSLSVLTKSGKTRREACITIIMTRMMIVMGWPNLEIFTKNTVSRETTPSKGKQMPKKIQTSLDTPR